MIVVHMIIGISVAILDTTILDVPNVPRMPSELWNAATPRDPVNNPETWNFKMRNTGGLVEALGPDSITLYRPKTQVIHLRYNTLTGDKIEEIKKEAFAAWPAKNFIVGEELKKGDFLKIAAEEFTYRLSDVKVGDWVRIEYDRDNGQDICRSICIHRRPNGRIPPAPGEKRDVFRKYHESVNADQEWEENGTQYPRKYWPSTLGQDGKFYEAPYPGEAIKVVYMRALAPPPRKVVPSSQRPR